MSQPFPVPSDELERLAALRRYEILDTAPEKSFDEVARAAALLFDAPVGAVAFIDAERTWFKTGSETSEIPRGASFCGHTISEHTVRIVRDALHDPLFSNIPILDETGERLRFYAGAPLVTHDGYRIGTLCVIDRAPHLEIRDSQPKILAALALVALNELELRFELQARIRVERDLALTSKIMSAIAEAPTGSEALEDALCLIAENVGADLATAWECLQRGNQVRVVAAVVEPGGNLSAEILRLRQLPLTLSNSLTGRALRHGKPELITNLAERLADFAGFETVVARGVQSAVSVPLIQSGAKFAFHFFFKNLPQNPENFAERIGTLTELLRPALSRKASEYYRSLFESIVLNASDAALVAVPEISADPNSPLIIAYANPAMSRMTGYSAEELLGLAPERLWDTTDETGDAANIGVQFPRDQQRRLEICFKRKDGSRFWGEIAAVQVTDDATGELKQVAIVRDITERRELDTVRRAREKDFELLFTKAPIAMMLSDRETYRYQLVNQAAIRLFGYSQEQFRAMSVHEIFLSEERERFVKILETPFQNDGRRGVWQYRKADGSAIPVDVTIHFMMYLGRPTSLTVAADLSDQKRVEDDMRTARDAALKGSRAKTDFLANMSHELRTPLNAIIGFSEIMQGELFGPLGSPRYLSYTDDILLSGRHLLTLINDILDLAKIEAGGLVLNEEDIDVAKLMASAVRLAGPTAETAGIDVKIRSTRRHLVIRADETALKRVLVNLLSNAVKFSEAGTMVWLSAGETAAGDVLISVKDQGIGIATSDIAAALTPFVQVHSGLARKYLGTGLGLPIAKELVELHGGRLLIESTLGIGTTVKIELPRSRVLGVEATQGNEPAHINAAYEATRSTQSFAPPRL
jgi:PAS domain S-box-containing protein